MEIRNVGEGNLKVSAIGLGCMGMSFAYGGASENEAIATIHKAVDLGVTFLDTAEVYGPYTNEELVGKAIRGLRSKVQIATKFGFRILPEGEGLKRMVGVDSRPEHIRRVVEGSLSRLGIETIDLMYQHRVDPAVPIEDVVGAMSDLVRQGKIKHLGLSEVSARTLRTAHAVHPIAAVQSEYSMWSRDPEQNGVLSACKELGIGFVPYSPLGRGFLTGKLLSTAGLSDDDFRRTLPRFQDSAMRTNATFLHKLSRLAQEKDCTLAQLCLGWLLHQGTYIVPIPGCRTMEHLVDNVGAVNVTFDITERQLLDKICMDSEIDGARYSAGEMTLVDR